MFKVLHVFSYPFLLPQLQESLSCPFLYYVQKYSSSTVKPVSSNLAYAGKKPLLWLTRMTNQNDNRVVYEVWFVPFLPLDFVTKIPFWS